MSYAHLHKDPRVGEVIQRLLDELASYERISGQEHILILLPLGSSGIPVCHVFGGFLSPARALRMAAESPQAECTDIPQHPHR